MILVSKSVGFPLLSQELIKNIFCFLLPKDTNPEYRRVNQGIKKIFDSSLEEQWKILESNLPDGPFIMQPTMDRINNRFAYCGSHPRGFHPLKLFRELHKAWGMMGIKIPKSEFRFVVFHNAQLQARLYKHIVDRSLMKIWEKMLPYMHLFTPHLTEPEQVKNWISDPSNSGAVAVISMTLKNLGLRYLPEEVSYFRGVKYLNLSGNDIKSLPCFIGDFKSLRHLVLDDNDIKKFPKCFPNWTHIRRIDLADNPLSKKGLLQLAQWQRNKKAIQQGVPMDLD